MQAARSLEPCRVRCRDVPWPGREHFPPGRRPGRRRLPTAGVSTGPNRTTRRVPACPPFLRAGLQLGALWRSRGCAAHCGPPRWGAQRLGREAGGDPPQHHGAGGSWDQPVAGLKALREGTCHGPTPSRLELDRLCGARIRRQFRLDCTVRGCAREGQHVPPPNRAAAAPRGDQGTGIGGSLPRPRGGAAPRIRYVPPHVGSRGHPPRPK